MEKAIVGKLVLAQMNVFLDGQRHTGRSASPDDLLFLTDSKWVKDTAVIDCVSKKHGAWDVALVFAHYKNPLKLIVRYITRCYSENKAKSVSFYMKKEAAKDSRGTLCVSLYDLDLCNN